MKGTFMALVASALIATGCTTDAPRTRDGFIAGTDPGPSPYASTARDVARIEDMAPDELAAFEASLQENVRAALFRAPGVDASTIDVRVTGNRVTLRGTVPTAQQRQYAVQVAASVAGVGSVRNDLSLR